MYVLILVIFDLFKHFKIGTFIYDIDIAINSFDIKLNKQWQIYQVVKAIMYNNTIYIYEIYAKISNILKYLLI